jgi:hypothetical protein
MAGMECLPLMHNTATPQECKHRTVISSVLELNWLYAAGTCVYVIVTSVWRYTEFVHYSLFHLASVLKLGRVAHS